jgi:general secretion pathway protein A
MYLEHFELKDYPFRLTPDTEYLYMSSAHAHAKAYMDYTVWNREGFVVITGEIGCGKTILIKKLLSELQDENFLVAKIFQTQLDEVELLQSVLVEFGLNPFNAKKVELIDMLNTFLIECFQQGKQLVLIVDDAHNLSIKALEEIRMLSGLETQKEKVLHVILVGQPQLNELLDLPEMEQLVQRVRLRFHLRPLSQDDTAAYIAHRLKVAGAARTDIFTNETVPIIYKYTAGIPRLINTLCDTALTVAYADELKTVTIEVLKEAIDELQWQPFDRRNNARRGKNQTKTGRGLLGDRSQQRETHGGAVARHGQIDMLGAVLSQLVDKLSNIEGYLAKIVDSRDSAETQKTTPHNTRKALSKDR